MENGKVFCTRVLTNFHVRVAVEKSRFLTIFSSIFWKFCIYFLQKSNTRLKNFKWFFQIFESRFSIFINKIPYREVTSFRIVRLKIKLSKNKYYSLRKIIKRITSPLVILFAHRIKNLSRPNHNLTILYFLFKKSKSNFIFNFFKLTRLAINGLTPSVSNLYKVNLKKKPCNTHSKHFVILIRLINNNII